MQTAARAEETQTQKEKKRKTNSRTSSKLLSTRAATLIVKRAMFCGSSARADPPANGSGISRPTKSSARVVTPSAAKAPTAPEGG